MALRLSTGLRNKVLGINLTKVTNGTFESATTGWTGTSASLALTGGGDGANSTTDSLTVTGSGGAGYAANSTAITIRNNHVYYFSCYFKKGTGTNGQIEIGTSAGDGSIYDSGSITDASWTKYETWFTVSGTEGGTTDIYITLNTDADAVTQLYDEVVLRNTARSIQEIFRGGKIEVYTGTQPTSADNAPSGTLLVTIKNGTAGITFDDAASGTMNKASGETWSGVCGNSGTAGWARLMTADDSGASATTEERFDMSVATSGSQINFSSTGFTASATQTITSFSISLAAS